MDQINCENPLEEHSRTIIHIDIDCFYAQVETLRNPNLKNVPLGIQQKNIVVTSNYLAREYGIKKCMLITEAKKLCPELVLANGEDLKNYRETSTKVHETIRKYSSIVERLGLDENFIDVTAAVAERLATENFHVIGNIYDGTNEENPKTPCYCGCGKRLAIGTQIAKEIRQAIFTNIGLTTCAGVAYNKLLAKLVGSAHKPNAQTVLFAEHVTDLLTNLQSIRHIPGVGYKTFEVIKTLGVNTVGDLLDCPVQELRGLLGREQADKVRNLCRGYDPSPVKNSGKPLSIGLEDSCRDVSGKSEVEIKFKQLLTRLVELVGTDGRIPTTLKITVRQFVAGQNGHRREQKQIGIPPSIFANFKTSLSAKSEEKLLALIMSLFHRIVDVKKPFHVTLLGLSFTKFLNRLKNDNIASFLEKNFSVQSVTNLQNDPTFKPDDTQNSIRTIREIPTDGSESEMEPSPKKCKIERFFAKRRCLDYPLDTPSPSKLRVADLRLNSREEDPLDCPPGVDPTVFNELPHDVQKDIVADWKKRPAASTSMSCAANRSSTKSTSNFLNKNSILNYLITDK